MLRLSFALLVLAFGWQRPALAVERGRIGKQRAHTRIVARCRIRQKPERQREIRLVRRHCGKQPACQRHVPIARLAQSKFCPQTRVINRLERRRKTIQRRMRLRHRRVVILTQQRQQCLSQARQVPERNLRLVAIRIAPGIIDRAIHRVRVKRIHEGARPVIDRLARHRHIVGIHNAMNKSHQQPARHQRPGPCNHRVQQRAIPVFRLGRRGVMAFDDIVCQRSARHPDRRGAGKTQTCRFAHGFAHTRQNCPRQPLVAQHKFAVVTAASARVVGMPSAAMASLTIYSRSTGPSAARPSPPREYGVRPGPFS